MIIRDDSGATFALMACPNCEGYEMHARVEGSDGTFQCAECCAIFRHLE